MLFITTKPDWVVSIPEESFLIRVNPEIEEFGQVQENENLIQALRRYKVKHQREHG